MFFNLFIRARQPEPYTRGAMGTYPPWINFKGVLGPIGKEKNLIKAPPLDKFLCTPLTMTFIKSIVGNRNILKASSCQHPNV